MSSSSSSSDSSSSGSSSSDSSSSDSSSSDSQSAHCFLNEERESRNLTTVSTCSERQRAFGPRDGVYIQLAKWTSESLVNCRQGEEWPWRRRGGIERLHGHFRAGIRMMVSVS
nr:suppressor protein SRP40-like isoform X2 [Myodes glareolus]XP_048282405.1 suppressor protein SRP40-like isoform X2 [Myodes glareolus]